MKSRRLRLAGSVFLAAALARGAGPAPTIHQQIQQTYNFQPHLLEDDYTQLLIAKRK